MSRLKNSDEKENETLFDGKKEKFTEILFAASSLLVVYDDKFLTLLY